MKSCSECKFASVGWLEWFLSGYTYAKCIHPSAIEPVEIDPVTGRLVGEDFAFCSINRMRSSDICGRDAELWEPK